MSEGASEFSEVRDFFYGRHLLRSEIPFSDQRIKRFTEKEYITAEPSIIRRKTVTSANDAVSLIKPALRHFGRPLPKGRLPIAVPVS